MFTAVGKGVDYDAVYRQINEDNFNLTLISVSVLLPPPHMSSCLDLSVPFPIWSCGYILIMHKVPMTVRFGLFMDFPVLVCSVWELCDSFDFLQYI